jgi:hypothetical protein
MNGTTERRWSIPAIAGVVQCSKPGGPGMRCVLPAGHDGYHLLEAP